MNIQTSLKTPARKNRWKTIVLLGSVVSLTTIAARGEQITLPASAWSTVISVGYTDFSNMYSTDGQTAIARLAIVRRLYAHNNWQINLETGVQNGNTMRLEQTTASYNLFDGNLPILLTIKPTIDLLTSLNKSFTSTAFFLQAKAGIAYRKCQFDNVNSINSLSQFAFETQFGVGYHINSRADLTLLYQGIFGANPNLIVNTSAGTGTVSNIPTQNGVLLSLSLGI